MDWSLGGRLELDVDDNVNIAAAGLERDDESLAAAVAAGRSYIPESSLHSNTRLGWKLDLAYRTYSQHDELSYAQAGGSLHYRHKFGLGLQAPRLSLAGSAQARRVDDGNRDATYYQASLSLEKRISPRLDLGAHGYYRSRDGRSWTAVAPGVNSNVYDSDHVELAAAGHYSLLPRLRLSLRGSYFDGKFDSDCADLLEPGSTGLYGGGLANLGREPDWESYSVKAIAVDAVFGCRWLADGDGYGASAELNWAVGASSSLRFRAAWREIQLDDYEKYSNTLFKLALQHRF